MSWGGEDLATALGATDNRGDYGGYDFTYELARSLCLVGAAAAGVPAIETIHGDFRDEAGLHKRATQMRRAGYRGMLAIHPAQIDVINEAFTPSAEELAGGAGNRGPVRRNPGAGTIGRSAKPTAAAMLASRAHDVPPVRTPWPDKRCESGGGRKNGLPGARPSSARDAHRRFASCQHAAARADVPASTHAPRGRSTCTRICGEQVHDFLRRRQLLRARA